MFIGERPAPHLIPAEKLFPFKFMLKSDGLYSVLPAEQPQIVTVLREAPPGDPSARRVYGISEQWDSIFQALTYSFSMLIQHLGQSSESESQEGFGPNSPTPSWARKLSEHLLLFAFTSPPVSSPQHVPMDSGYLSDETAPAILQNSWLPQA